VVASLEILSPRNLFSSTTPPHFRKELLSPTINFDKNLLKNVPCVSVYSLISWKADLLEFRFRPPPYRPSHSDCGPRTRRSPPWSPPLKITPDLPLIWKKSLLVVTLCISAKASP